MKEWIIFDSHNDTMMRVVDQTTLEPVINIGEPTNFHIDIPKMIEGNANIAIFAAFTTDHGSNEKNISVINSLINALKYTEMKNPDTFSICRNYEEVRDALNSGKRIGIHSIEGAYSINEENMEGLLRQYRDLGVKMIAPVWNLTNALGGGTLEQIYDGTPSKIGLTQLGQKFIGQMSELNMIVDVSHMNEATFWDTIHSTQRPIIASHSGAYQILVHPRNLKDEQLKAVAKTGGVVCAVFCRSFIGDEQAGVSELVDHIEHMIKVMGEDHVGLGSDFDGAKMPVDLENISQIGKVAETLIVRGYSKETVSKIMGLNMLRILKTFSNEPNRNHTFENPLVENNTNRTYSVKLTDSEVYTIEPINAKLSFYYNGVSINGHYNKDNMTLVCEVKQLFDFPYPVITISAETLQGERYYCTKLLETKK